MVSHVKTTMEIDIADVLLEAARSRAAREGRTLEDIVEEALRAYLGVRQVSSKKFRLRPCAFHGKGLQPGVTEGRWEEIRDRIYPT